MKRDYEAQAARRARKVNDIRSMFARRMVEENKKPDGERKTTMEIYEEVAYAFYLSQTEIREIIAGRR